MIMSDTVSNCRVRKQRRIALPTHGSASLATEEDCMCDKDPPQVYLLWRQNASRRLDFHKRLTSKQMWQCLCQPLHDRQCKVLCRSV